MENQPEYKGYLSFDELLAKHVHAGWDYVGLESTIMTPLNSETGRFEKVTVADLESIKKKYSENGKNEVEVVPYSAENYLVFIKIKK